MAKCDICGRGTVFGHNVSHSNKKTPRIWRANVQRKKIVINGVKKYIHICSKCLKSGRLLQVER